MALWELQPRQGLHMETLGWQNQANWHSQRPLIQVPLLVCKQGPALKEELSRW